MRVSALRVSLLMLLFVQATFIIGRRWLAAILAVLTLVALPAQTFKRRLSGTPSLSRMPSRAPVGAFVHRHPPMR
jgi:hypothetical protein